jgi:hypothetical protein
VGNRVCSEGNRRGTSRVASLEQAAFFEIVFVQLQVMAELVKKRNSDFVGVIEFALFAILMNRS